VCEQEALNACQGVQLHTGCGVEFDARIAKSACIVEQVLHDGGAQ
jgi:hypothetical protein